MIFDILRLGLGSRRPPGRGLRRRCVAPVDFCSCSCVFLRSRRVLRVSTLRTVRARGSRFTRCVLCFEFFVFALAILDWNRYLISMRPLIFVRLKFALIAGRCAIGVFAVLLGARRAPRLSRTIGLRCSCVGLSNLSASASVSASGRRRRPPRRRPCALSPAPRRPAGCPVRRPPRA